MISQSSYPFLFIISTSTDSLYVIFIMYTFQVLHHHHVCHFNILKDFIQNLCVYDLYPHRISLA